MTREPAPPESGERLVLKRLSAVLIRLHRALIQAEAKEFGPVDGPYQLLSLVSGHPHFAWLDAFTKLIVEIDEARSPKGTIGDGQVAGYVRRIHAMTDGAEGEDASTPGRYLVLLERHADVAREHEELRRALADLPAG